MDAKDLNEAQRHDRPIEVCQQVASEYIKEQGSVPFWPNSVRAGPAPSLPIPCFFGFNRF